MSLDKKIQKSIYYLTWLTPVHTSASSFICLLFYNMTATFLLGLFLSPLLWHPTVGDLDGSGDVFDYEQQMDNTSNKS